MPDGRQQSCQEPEERVQKYRERLAALVAGGQAKQYGLVVHGKALTADQIDALDNSEIEKLYARYEARLGAAMTKTLGSAALQIYAGVIGQFVPIPDQLGLIRDLESDPFVGHALSSATCELYHRYGMWLAPLTTTLITLKHARFGHCCPVRVDDVDGEQTSSLSRAAKRRHCRLEQSCEHKSRHSQLRSQLTELRKLLLRGRRIQKKWQPGAPPPPPERPSKNDCSNSFGRPRNHFVQAQLTRQPIFRILRKRTQRTRNDRNITAVGPHGLLGLVLRAVHSCFFRDCAPRKCHKWQARQSSLLLIPPVTSN